MTKGSRLTVGPDIKLKGAEITDCDTLVVEGRVEASMDARVIQISESGSFHGTVGVDVAEIRGRFDGEMTARKQLIIHPGGKVTGKIHYGKIVIEEGGELSGDVGTISGAKPASPVLLAETGDPGGEPLVGCHEARGHPPRAPQTQENRCRRQRFSFYLASGWPGRRLLLPGKSRRCEGGETA